MAINGYFASGLQSGLDKGIRAIFSGQDAFNSAQMKGSLMGAQTAAAGTKAALDQQKLDLVGRAVAALDLPGLDPREQFNYQIAAANGQQVNPFDFDYKSGTAANKATGRMDVADAGLRAIFGNQAAADTAASRARATASYAAAGASNASAAASRAGIDKPIWDSKRGVFLHPTSGIFTTPVGAGGAQLPAGIDPAAKPLPPTVLKMQQENLDSIALAGSISADLDTLIGQFKNGKLDVGPLLNPINEGLNAIGASTEGSRNYASLQASLEKLRNDSMRLNKGVQTEGDAVRAWNEMFKNLNDPKVVVQRLQEISAINRRAAELRAMQNDLLRAQFGHDPMDYTSFMSPGSVLGGAQAASDSGAGIDALLEKYR
ncbi:hypothetical protein [Castellaniella sp.]|uniref:hypothetical protein n=1 Tax=Castellaniella sp. TaxID=1955812 RepID=UPI003A9347EA